MAVQPLRFIHANTPTAISRWLQVTAESRIDRPFGRLHSYDGKVIIRLWRRLTLDVFLPHLIRQIPARCQTVSLRPQILPQYAFVNFNTPTAAGGNYLLSGTAPLTIPTDSALFLSANARDHG
jgi:hypothetical protein